MVSYLFVKRKILYIEKRSSIVLLEIFFSIFANDDGWWLIGFDVGLELCSRLFPGDTPEGCLMTCNQNFDSLWWGVFLLLW